jgi:DNA-binding MarR family transcriptional regulator
MPNREVEGADRVTASIQSLFRLGGSRRIHQQQTTAAGISVSQQALRVLERTVQSAGTTPGQLAALLDLDPAVVTRLLRQLEDAGFVRRQRSPDDGRVNTVEATEAGRAAFDRFRQVIWGQVRRALADWPDADVGTLASLLDRLLADVQREPYRTESGS